MTQPTTSKSTALSTVAQVAEKVRTNVEQVLVGKAHVIEMCLAGIMSGGHILIEDVPGIGKTTLARSLADSINCTFRRIQFTPDLMPSDITGIHFYNQKSSEFEFRPGPIIAQVVLADEINRATPRTQSALLEAMAEGQVTVDNTTITLPAPFLVIATQNPIELEGTFPLPEAQLDRFLLRIKLGYPQESEEEDMLARFQSADPLANLQPVASSQEIVEHQTAVRSVYVDPVLRNYLVQVVQATRSHPDVELGASPRASMGLYRCSQAMAAIQGRDYVSPDDIKLLAPYTLGHRMILKSQARLRERTTEDAIVQILDQIPVPV
jgi:MoxR-like ATPase